MTRIREDISTRMPHPDETQLLHLRPGVPVIYVWHTSIDEDGQPYGADPVRDGGDITGLLYGVTVEGGARPWLVSPCWRGSGAEHSWIKLADLASPP